MSELSLGGPQDGSENLDNCMYNYQWAKRQRKNAEKKGNDKRRDRATADMVYWEHMMLAYGAYSLQQCAMVGSGAAGGDWDDPYYVEQRDHSTKVCMWMESHGAPLLDLDYKPVPHDEDD